LQIQTGNNGAITTGSGLFTVGGKFNVSGASALSGVTVSGNATTSSLTINGGLTANSAAIFNGAAFYAATTTFASATIFSAIAPNSLFYATSTGQLVPLTLGSGLTLTSGTLTASSSEGSALASPSATGQLVVASSTSWVVGNLVAGTNITITTTTPGSITIASSGGGGTPGGSSGQVQYNNAGSFAGQSSIFSDGAKVQRAVECATGTVPYTSLTAAATNQEITIQTGISGNVSYDQVLVSETTQFAGTFSGLTVSMGRPGTNDYELTGTLVPLMVSSGDTNFWTSRPSPPQLTGTYSVVLNFASTGANVNTATAGNLTWEMCGYAAR
jgi:hypothetical protein